jgi:hypothetical protein
VSAEPHQLNRSTGAWELATGNSEDAMGVDVDMDDSWAHPGRRRERGVPARDARPGGGPRPGPLVVEEGPQRLALLLLLFRGRGGVHGRQVAPPPQEGERLLLRLPLRLRQRAHRALLLLPQVAQPRPELRVARECERRALRRREAMMARVLHG